MYTANRCNATSLVFSGSHRGHVILPLSHYRWDNAYTACTRVPTLTCFTDVCHYPPVVHNQLHGTSTYVSFSCPSATAVGETFLVIWDLFVVLAMRTELIQLKKALVRANNWAWVQYIEILLNLIPYSLLVWFFNLAVAFTTCHIWLSQVVIIAVASNNRPKFVTHLLLVWFNIAAIFIEWITEW